MLERLKNEPVLVSAVIIAIGNALGHDLTPLEGFIQTGVVLVVGFITRHFVSPTRTLG